MGGIAAGGGGTGGIQGSGAAFNWGAYTFLFRWDFTDSTALWQDDGTAPAGSGDYVHRVDDQSGNDHHLKQSSPLTQPQVVTVADGTGLAVDFPGTDEFMQPDALTASADDWVFMALADFQGANARFFDVQTGRLILLPNATLGAYYDLNYKGADINASGLQIIVWMLVAPTSAAIYVDGVEDQSGLGYTQRAFGGEVAFGANYDGGSLWWNGAIRHLWGATRANMTNDQINEIGNELATTHGLSWTDIT